MLKTLIALEADLASRIAIRYACQLVKQMTMDLHTIHVVEPDHEGHTVGTGWVRQTWEDSMVRINRDKIIGLVRTEKASCPDLKKPKFIFGERDIEIRHELHMNSYDLLIEGILHEFEPAKFFKKIHSKFYRNLPCPILLVKNMVSLQKGILVMGEEDDLMKSISIFLRIFRKLPIEPEILCCQVQKTEPREGGERQHSKGVIEAVEKALTAQGRKSGKIRTAQGTPTSLSPNTRDYGLVISSMPEENSPLADLLSRCPSPMLLCRH